MKPKNLETLVRNWDDKEYLDDISLYMAWQNHSWNVNMLKFHWHSTALYQIYARINPISTQPSSQETQESEETYGRPNYALQRSIEVLF